MITKSEAQTLWTKGNNDGLGYAPYTDEAGDDTVQAAIDAAIADGWEHIIRAENADEIDVLQNEDGELMGIGDANGAWAVALEMGVTITASISDGMSRNGGGETEITADTLADAIEQAEDWAREGSYSSFDSDTVNVSLVIARHGAVIDRRTVIADATREAV